VKDAANREPHYPEYETDSAHIFLFHCFPRVKLRRFPVRCCRYEIVNLCFKLEQWYCRIDVHRVPMAVTSYGKGILNVSARSGVRKNVAITYGEVRKRLKPAVLKIKSSVRYPIENSTKSLCQPQDRCLLEFQAFGHE
jgi:hypothetical protein